MVAIAAPKARVQGPKVMGRTDSIASGIFQWLIFLGLVGLVAALGVFRATGGSPVHGQNVFTDAQYLEEFGYPKPGSAGGGNEVAPNVDTFDPNPETAPNPDANAEFIVPEHLSG